MFLANPDSVLAMQMAERVFTEDKAKDSVVTAFLSGVGTKATQYCLGCSKLVLRYIYCPAICWQNTAATTAAS